MLGDGAPKPDRTCPAISASERTPPASQRYGRARRFLALPRSPAEHGRSAFRRPRLQARLRPETRAGRDRTSLLRRVSHRTGGLPRPVSSNVRLCQIGGVSRSSWMALGGRGRLRTEARGPCGVGTKPLAGVRQSAEAYTRCPSALAQEMSFVTRLVAKGAKTEGRQR